MLALYKWFSVAHGFAYSTSTKPGTTGTDIGNFLMNKVGYCVQFAAALAWLVRRPDTRPGSRSASTRAPRTRIRPTRGH